MKKFLRFTALFALGLFAFPLDAGEPKIGTTLTLSPWCAANLGASKLVPVVTGFCNSPCFPGATGCCANSAAPCKCEARYNCGYGPGLGSVYEIWSTLANDACVAPKCSSGKPKIPVADFPCALCGVNIPPFPAPIVGFDFLNRCDNAWDTQFMTCPTLEDPAGQCDCSNPEIGCVWP